MVYGHVEELKHGPHACLYDEGLGPRAYITCAPVLRCLFTCRRKAASRKLRMLKIRLLDCWQLRARNTVRRMVRTEDSKWFGTWIQLTSEGSGSYWDDPDQHGEETVKSLRMRKARGSEPYGRGFGRVTDRPEGGLERRTLSTRRRRRMHRFWSTYERWAAARVVARSPGTNETLPLIRATHNTSPARQLSRRQRGIACVSKGRMGLGSATSSTPGRKVQSST
jgi:hypothetical protein